MNGSCSAVRLFVLTASLLTCGCSDNGKNDSASSSQEPLLVGAAKVDITPDYPVRLSGYGGRKTWNEGIEQKLWARALVIGDKNPVAVVTVDAIAVPRSIAEAAAQQLNEKFSISRERVVFSSTHSHTAPHPSRDYLPTIFGIPLSEEEWQVVDRYGQQMLQGIIDAVSQAMEQRKTCRLSWAQGEVGFAMNRRKMESGQYKGFGEQPDGAVDHALPLIVAQDADGKVVAMLTNYACHCTTLSGNFNQVCGDWAGYASDGMEQKHEGAVGLVMIGCGADANPKDRGELSVSKKHGEALAAEVERLLAGDMKELHGLPEAKFQFVDLPLADVPSRQELEKKAADDKARSQERQLAQRFLQQLDAGDKLQTSVSLPVQTWNFDNQLSMVFLGGEVVVDYSLQLKEVYKNDKLWVSAYCNDVPCYIPTIRILNEGGYEADRSMVYYARPSPFRPEVEKTLMDAITTMLPLQGR